MEGLNKIISLIIGLVIVAVFFAVITGRINLGRKTTTTSPTSTPTPTKTGSLNAIVRKITPAPTLSYKVNRYQTSPSAIPSTGAPTILLPVLLSALGLGVFFRQKN